MANAKFENNGIPTAMGVDGTGVMRALLTDATGTLLTSASSVVADTSQTGTISANTSVTLALTGQASATVQIINTGFTGTLNFEESTDGGTTYNAVALWPVGSTATGNLVANKAFVTDSTTSLFEGNVSAASNFRVRGSTVTAGSSAITIRAGLSTSSVVLDGPLPTGSNTIGAVTGSGNFAVTQTTPASLTTQSSGVSASGAAVSGNPVLAGGTDGTNAQSLRTTTPTNAPISSGVTGLLAVASLMDDGGQGRVSLSTRNLGENTTGGSLQPTAGMVGTTGTNFVFARTPNKFFTATATAAGDTAVWTPASGKKFRLMRFTIMLTDQSTTAGGANIEAVLRDGTTAIGVGGSFFVPNAAISAFGNDSLPWIDLGNGFLSATANNVLNVNLSAALATGEARVIVCGTEE